MHTIPRSIYQIFQLLGMGVSAHFLKTAAPIRNAFAIQSNVFIQTVAKSEIQMPFQLMALNSNQSLHEYVLTMRPWDFSTLNW